MFRQLSVLHYTAIDKVLDLAWAVLPVAEAIPRASTQATAPCLHRCASKSS
jgi:hypothetical protein